MPRTTSALPHSANPPSSARPSLHKGDFPVPPEANVKSELEAYRRIRWGVICDLSGVKLITLSPHPNRFVREELALFEERGKEMGSQEDPRRRSRISTTLHPPLLDVLGGFLFGAAADRAIPPHFNR